MRAGADPSLALGPSWKGPASFAEDAGRVARLRSEAQIPASLNHPSIAAIYGLEESDGIVALALDRRAGKGAMTLAAFCA